MGSCGQAGLETGPGLLTLSACLHLTLPLLLGTSGGLWAGLTENGKWRRAARVGRVVSGPFDSRAWRTAGGLGGGLVGVGLEGAEGCG